MNDKEIFDLAEKYGEWDDFGRWTFRTDDKLLRFVVAVQEAEKQEPLVWMNKYGHVASFKNDEYTAPLYTAPVHASDISQERVDETAKGGHEFECPRCGHCCKEWVGLDGDIPGLGLVTEEFYNGMIFAEDILREKNT
jgi:hypothetical protein